MMGALKPFLRQWRRRLAAIDIRQAHIHDDQVDLSDFGGSHAFATVLDRDRFKFFVQRKPFRQFIPQFRIVIDNQNFISPRH
jgi:hypothetical protein